MVKRSEILSCTDNKKGICLSLLCITVMGGGGNSLLAQITVLDTLSIYEDNSYGLMVLIKILQKIQVYILINFYTKYN